MNIIKKMFVLHPEVIDERDAITFIDLGQD